MTDRKYNGLRIEAYSSGTTPIKDPSGDFTNAENVQFSTIYPGGLYADASFYVSRDVLKWWALKGAKRVVFRNGLKAVYEGVVDDLESILNESDQGISVPLTGQWGAIMMRRSWRKWWADKRLDESVWIWQTTATGAEKCYIDRNTRLRFTPKAEAWGNNEYAQVKYTSPTGETVKRVTFNYDLQEGGQAWYIGLYNVGTSSYEWSVNATGTGSVDQTLGTASQSIMFVFISQAAQTPTSDGTYYGEISSLTVYSETGSINAQEILTDIVGKISTLNSDTSNIGALTLSLVPFINDTWNNTVADIVDNAASFGDASFNRWAYGLLHSEKAASPDGKPVLFLEQYPALTDYEYALRIDEQNLRAPLSIVRNFDSIWNWIIVEYEDQDGRKQWSTPDDDANLKDTTSISDYGQRDYCLSLGPATSTMAINAGRRFLANYKDPQYRITSPITVIGYIRGKKGQPVPSSEIVAGKRIKIENYLQDLSGTGLTFLITGTRYNDTDETCTITIGAPPDLIFYPGFAFPQTPPVDQGPSADSMAQGGYTGKHAYEHAINPATGKQFTKAEWRAAKAAGGSAWAAAQRAKATWQKKHKKKQGG